MCRNHAPIGHTGFSLENNKWLATGSTDPSFRWGDCSSQKPTNADPPWLGLICMVHSCDAFSRNWKTQHVILSTRFIERSLLLSRLANQQLIQVCKIFNQASHLAGAGALRIPLHFPLLPGVCSNVRFGTLAPRLRPWFGLCCGQREDRSWVFCNSTQRSRQCCFLRRFHGQPRHCSRLGQFGRLEQEMAKDNMMKEAWHS